MLVHDFIRLKEERGGLAGDAGMDGNLAQYMDDDDNYQITGEKHYSCEALRYAMASCTVESQSHLFLLCFIS